jgi:hypothetical protein
MGLSSHASDCEVWSGKGDLRTHNTALECEQVVLEVCHPTPEKPELRIGPVVSECQQKYVIFDPIVFAVDKKNLIYQKVDVGNINKKSIHFDLINQDKMARVEYLSRFDEKNSLKISFTMNDIASPSKFSYSLRGTLTKYEKEPDYPYPEFPPFE